MPCKPWQGAEAQARGPHFFFCDSKVPVATCSYNIPTRVGSMLLVIICHRPRYTCTGRRDVVLRPLPWSAVLHSQYNIILQYLRKYPNCKRTSARAAPRYSSTPVPRYCNIAILSSSMLVVLYTCTHYCNIATYRYTCTLVYSVPVACYRYNTIP